jgi:DNA-binding transcriptional LysR family regulator
MPRTVQFSPRLAINSIRAAVASAVGGLGIARVFSYQVAEHVRQGELEILLADHERPPLPVHMVAPHGRLSAPKVRAFMDYAVPRLRKHFTRQAKDLT